MVEYLPIFMFLALMAALLSGMPVAFALGGVALGFGLIGELVDVFSFGRFYAIVLRMYGGSMNNLILVAVPLFIFMGVVLEKSRVADDLLGALSTLLRRVPGGLAIGVTVIATVMAATTGIIGASVVMMTMIALPAMLDRGYRTSFASGTVAASATLGILIPPSIMLVFLGDLMTISVGSLFAAALVPGVMLAGLYMIYAATMSLVRPDAVYTDGAAGARRASEAAMAESGSLLSLVIAFIAPVFLIVLVLGSILSGWATPTEAAGVGAAGALLIAALRRKLNRATTNEILSRAMTTTGMLFAILLAATCFSYVFRVLGGDALVTQLFEQAGFGSWGALVTILAIVFVLGFFFDWIEISLIAVPIFYPILEQLSFGGHVGSGQVLVWFAILLSLNLQTSFLTPPFGYALFFLKGVAPPQVRITDIYRGVAPFVLLQLIMVGLVAAYPSIGLWLPRAVGLD